MAQENRLLLIKNQQNQENRQVKAACKRIAPCIKRPRHTTITSAKKDTNSRPLNYKRQAQAL